MVVKGHYRQQHRRRVHQKLHFKNANAAETFPVKPEDMWGVPATQRFPRPANPLPTQPATNDFDRFVESNGIAPITNATVCVINGEYFVLIVSTGIQQIGLVNRRPSIRAYSPPQNPNSTLLCAQWVPTRQLTIQEMAEFHRTRYVPENPEDGKKFAMSIASALGILDGNVLRLFNAN